MIGLEGENEGELYEATAEARRQELLEILPELRETMETAGAGEVASGGGFLAGSLAAGSMAGGLISLPLDETSASSRFHPPPQRER